MTGAQDLSTTPPLSIHAWLRYSVIESLLAGITPSAALEIGVGQGSVGVLLARRYDYIGIDMDETSLASARHRFRRYGADPDKLLLGGLERVEGREFDLVCAFEVLEHLEDDVGALAEWRAHVDSAGWIVLSVPANPQRFSKADEKAGHFRRYTRESLTQALTAGGFKDIRLCNYGFPVGYLLEAGRSVAARRYLRTAGSYEERTLESGRWLQPPDGVARIMKLTARPLSLATPLCGARARDRSRRSRPARGIGTVGIATRLK